MIALGNLRQGWADVVLAGGAESTMPCGGWVFLWGFCEMRPEKASRPFDAERDGFVIGEGAAVLVLETMEHARKRGAEILALLSGFGMTCDAYNIAIPEPDGKSAVLAMKQAVQDAKLNLEDIQHVNAHGTSTKVNDKAESHAIRSAFGDPPKEFK
jgi:3-oxoacyl-[acyl-carrier-protein] synthase II